MNTKEKHQNPARTSHIFTEAKVKMLMEMKGMELTGYILTNSDTNRFALVDKGRVRWYSFEEGMVVLGHEENKNDAED